MMQQTKKMNMESSSFTIKDAIQIQLEQLFEWKTVLNEETFKALAEQCIKMNKRKVNVWGKPVTANDVFRGVDMDNFVCNIAASNIRNKKS